ncbi:hypothetical protein C8R47DRAFT_972276, partial [Mycena vitilis]
ICLLLVAWLNLHAGFSRRTANTVLKALQFILVTVLQLVFNILQSAGVDVQPPIFKLPQDVRTIYQLGMEPEIIRTACCPTCYTLYPATRPIPEICRWRRSPRAQPCGTELWRDRKTRKGVKRVPARLYSTQSFDSWLRFFLARPVIEDYLAKSAQKNLNRGPPSAADIMHDVQDSPAWRSLGNYVTFQYNLVWAVYIDWFNPFTNKIAGKVISCGAIILYCLNLPIEIRFLLENIFILGMIPGQGMPDTWTISHIFDSFVKAMNKYKAPGKLTVTHHHPEGVLVQSRVVPLLADLGAIRKVAGFLAHNAIQFCSFCVLPITDIDNLDYGSWTYRDGQTVKRQGREWKALIYIKDKDTKSKETGVRWTPVHDFWGWDPVAHIVLGFMHNSLEGLAEHHLRVLWGIGRHARIKQDLADQKKAEQFYESDASEASQDLDNLAAESRSSAASVADDEMEIDVDHTESSASTTPTPENPGDLYMGNEDDDEDDEEDYVPPDFDSDVFNFTPEELEMIRECIKNVQLPTWVGRPPTNLGEASHGKLKAQELLILFTVIFPLIIPELWWNQGDVATRLLDNFYSLVACTNIISSYSASNAEADRYMAHLVNYRTLLRQLFSQFNSMPNHHFAMHNKDLLKFWGPLAVLSEFPGERMNGEFGKVATNKRIYDMDLTMLRQTARRGRLEAMLTDSHFQQDISSDDLVGQLARILQPDASYLNKALKPLSGLEAAQILASGKDTSVYGYTMILNYLHSVGQPRWRSITDLPHFAEDLVLPPTSIQPTEIELDGKTYSCKRSHEGGSGIQFKNPVNTAELLTGYIEQIWQIPLEGRMQTFILVRKHTIIPQWVTAQSPFRTRPDFQTTIVDTAPSDHVCIIEPTHILTHLTIYRRPKGTYGIMNREILVVCWALNRGRRS